MSLMRTYSFRDYQLNKSKKTGFTVDGDRLTSEDHGERLVYLEPLDGAEEGMQWGRLHYECSRGEENVILMRAISSDIKLDEEKLKELFRKIEPRANHEDILLFENAGRYLYLMIEVRGEGVVSISNIKVMNPGDNFLNTFPEIYRKRGSTFHRYLSVFSSIYNDFDEKIDNIDEILDIEKAPEEFLSYYAQWLGIRLEASVPIEVYRKLLREAYELNSIKGTAEAFKRIVRLLTGYECKIIERVFWDGQYLEKNREMLEELFGKDDNCVTILIYGEKDFVIDKALASLLNQFKPAMVQISIIYIGAGEVMDSYSFLSGNAKIMDRNEGIIDKKMRLGDGLIMS